VPVLHGECQCHRHKLIDERSAGVDGRAAAGPQVCTGTRCRSKGRWRVMQGCHKSEALHAFLLLQRKS
jgi:hypothetical protein